MKAQGHVRDAAVTGGQTSVAAAPEALAGLGDPDLSKVTTSIVVSFPAAHTSPSTSSSTWWQPPPAQA